MANETVRAMLNRMTIMILLGTFIAAELLYLAPEYKFGLSEVFRLMGMIMK